MSPYINMQAFIIHLERATDRKDQVQTLADMLQQTKVFNKTTILPAIDAKNLSQQEIENYYQYKLLRPCYPFSLKRSEIACFLSHRRAWQKVVNHHLDAALITEDDMQPNKYFDANLKLAEQHIKSCGLIRFPHYICEKGKVLAQTKDSKLILPRRIGLGMVGYMVSRDAAVKLLAATKQFDRPIDVILQMFWITEIHSATLIPGGINEVSASLGGSTLAQTQILRQKLKRELYRPIYRTYISLLSLLKG